MKPAKSGDQVELFVLDDMKRVSPPLEPLGRCEERQLKRVARSSDNLQKTCRGRAN